MEVMFILKRGSIGALYLQPIRYFYNVGQFRSILNATLMSTWLKLLLVYNNRHLIQSQWVIFKDFAPELGMICDNFNIDKWKNL